MTGSLIVLAAGGTGGHVFPAEALAGVLAARGFQLALFTDRRGGAFGNAAAGLDAYRLHAAAFAGGVLRRSLALVELGRGFLQARRLVGRLGPAVVVGFGGYPSMAPMIAAMRAGVPTLIHEQNAVLGRANRLLAGRATRIATCFSAVRGLAGAAGGRAVLTGNPVRPAILALRDRPLVAPAANAPFRLLVTGGSQGAAIFSRVVPAALARLDAAQRARIAVVQQCRAEDLDSVRAAYRQNGVAAELSSFFADLPDRLSAAHLVIGRAGASTVAEITVAGRAAILVPYPAAADDHQSANAASLANEGAAWGMAQADFTPAALAVRLAALINNPAEIVARAGRAGAMGRPRAAEHLADLVGLLAAERPLRSHKHTSMGLAA